MARIYKEICITDSSDISATSTSWAGTGDSGIVEYDPDWYDQVEGVYFEASLYADEGGGFSSTVSARLYNATDGCEVPQSEVSLTVDGSPGESNYAIVRSGDLSSLITASGSKEYYVQYKASATGSGEAAVLQTAKFVTIQDGDITKTATHWNIGQVQNTSATTYTELNYPKRVLYTSSDYDGTVAVEFHATLGHWSSGATSYAELADGATQKAECSLTSTTATLVKDTSVSSLTSGNELKVNTKTSAGRTTARIFNAHLIILQTGTITATVSPIHVQTGYEYFTNTTYPLVAENRARWNDGDWSNLTSDERHEATGKRGSLGTNYSKLNGDIGASSSTELSFSTTVPTRKRSASDCGISGTNAEMDAFHKCALFSNGHMYQNRLLVFATDMTFGETDTVTIDSDAHVSKLDTVTIDSDMVVAAGIVTDTTTIESDAHVSKLDTVTIDSDGHVSKTDTVTIESGGHVSKLDTTTIESDGHVKKSDTTTIESDAVVGKSDTVTIDSDGHVSKLDTVTIESDCHIKGTDTTTIDSDAHVATSDTTTIDSDSHVRKLDTTTIDSDAHVKGTDTETIESDAHVAKSDTTTIDSDMVVTQSDTVTIGSDSHVSKLDTVTIESDGHVKGTETVTIGSDAVVSTVVEDTVTIESDAHVLATETVTVNSDMNVTKSETVTITSGAVIARTDLVTIDSSAHIARTNTTTISSDAHVKTSDLTTLLSDASVNKIDTVTITSNAQVRGRVTITSDMVIRSAIPTVKAINDHIIYPAKAIDEIKYPNKAIDEIKYPNKVIDDSIGTEHNE